MGKWLFHGQVALGADCILIANDGVVKDDLEKNHDEIGKTCRSKTGYQEVLRIRIEAINSGVTDKYKLFDCCGISVKDAYALSIRYNKH